MSRNRRVMVIALALAVAGCSGFINNQAATSTYRILEHSMEAARRESDVELARDAMPSGLMQLEAFSLAYPDHPGFETLHTEALCQYAAAFVFDDWEDAKLGGRDAVADGIAERLVPLLGRCVELNLARLPAPWRQAAKTGEAFVALLATAKPDQVGPLLWIATADAITIALDPMHNFAKLPGVQATLTRITELAPGFHAADAELLLATLEAGRAAVFGGGDGHAAFELARSRAGTGMLIVDVMYARGTAVARKDRALFVATLERVVATDVTRWPERRLANELARRKARRYLAAAATLIPE